MLVISELWRLPASASSSVLLWINQLLDFVFTMDIITSISVSPALCISYICLNIQNFHSYRKLKQEINLRAHLNYLYFFLHPKERVLWVFFLSICPCRKLKNLGYFFMSIFMILALLHFLTSNTLSLIINILPFFVICADLKILSWFLSSQALTLDSETPGSLVKSLFLFTH